MTDLAHQPTLRDVSAGMLTDAWGNAGDGMAPGNGWSQRPRLVSSDIVAWRNKDGFNADARDLSRTNPYGKAATQTTTDAIIGARLKLQLSPKADVLGVDPDAALAWAQMVEQIWESDANSSSFCLDAARKQTFTGLMRTAYDVVFVSGEGLGTIEWEKSFSDIGTRTCLNLLAPERLSDPRYTVDYTGKRRMGVERNRHGAPIAFHIRTMHPSDAGVWGFDNYKWDRIDRFTPWGRPKVLHFFEQDQADMTRGLSPFTSVALSMRMLSDYMTTELESAAIRATYAAVIEADMDYEEAMNVIGPEMRGAIQGNGPLDMQLKLMTQRANYYRGQEFRFGKSKVAHLLPGEELKMIQGSPKVSGVKEFNDVSIYPIATGLGVSAESLTKNFSDTNYSGARASLYNVFRSHMVRRQSFMDQFAWPFFGAWLEEHVALRETIPMLGKKSFYEARDAILCGTFETWGKQRLDPLKEVQADGELYKRGAMSLRDLCAAEGTDYAEVLKQRSREKAMMKALGLEPEDIDWDLIMNQGADPVKSDNSGGSQK